MPGPAPNPNARRRNNRGDWRALPARCDLEAPEWPHGRKGGARARELWAHLWATPQAVIWHESPGAWFIVARYVLLSGAAETAADHGQLVRLEVELLLTPSALLKARCLVADEPAERDGDAEVVELDEYRDLYGSA